MSEVKGDYLRKPLPGDKLVIPARLMGEVIDTVRYVRGLRTGDTPPLLFGGAGQTVVLVRNDSGADRNRFAVLGVSTPRILPSDNLNDFVNRPLLSGVTPTTDHRDRFVILLEPLAAGQIGRAVLAGLAVARVAVATDTAGFKQVQAQTGDSSALALASQGAQLLWREGGGDGVTEWALIRFGGTQGGVASTIGVPPGETAPIEGTLEVAPGGELTTVGTAENPALITISPHDNLLVSGGLITNPGSETTINGGFRLGHHLCMDVHDFTMIGAQTDDFAGDPKAWWRLANETVIGGGEDITEHRLSGIVAPDGDGCEHWITNRGPNPLILLHQSPDSVEANRLYSPTAWDWYVEPDASVLIRYDNVLTRWRILRLETEMRGATSLAPGRSGLVPAPEVADLNSFLKGDGTWDTVAGASVMTGATATEDGAIGLVPQPVAGDHTKFLRGDATWQAIGGSPGSSGAPMWRRYNFDYTDFQVVGQSNVVRTVVTLSATEVVHWAYLTYTQRFLGGVIATCEVDLGYTPGGLGSWVGEANVFAEAASYPKKLGNYTIAPPVWPVQDVATGAVAIQMTVTSDTLDQLTQGALQVYLLISDVSTATVTDWNP